MTSTKILLSVAVLCHLIKVTVQTGPQSCVSGSPFTLFNVDQTECSVDPLCAANVCCLGNLGGIGVGTGPEELRYENIASGLDLVVEVVSDSYVGSGKKNGLSTRRGGLIGQISLEAGESVSWRFSFVTAGGTVANDLVDPFDFTMFFLDMDQDISAGGVPGGETLVVYNFDKCILTGSPSASINPNYPGNDQSDSYNTCDYNGLDNAGNGEYATLIKVTPVTGGAKFESTIDFGGANNPTDEVGLDNDAMQLAAGFSFFGKNQFTIDYSSTGTETRNLLFSPRSNLLNDCPTASPTRVPTMSPSFTRQPTTSPTSSSPTTTPTKHPVTSSPSRSPSAVPTTAAPSNHPTASPVTSSPSSSPSAQPTTAVPSVSPTTSPTSSSPTLSPSASPTTSTPTALPTTANPTNHPTQNPTTSVPSTSPSVSPTESHPTMAPTTSPTSSHPTTSPSSSAPTSSPTVSPSTSNPTKNPTSSAPTDMPTHFPTRLPTTFPTKQPTTSSPTSAPTSSSPSESPTHIPTHSPTFTHSPSSTPTTSLPTDTPTESQPTSFPTLSPITSSPSDSPVSSSPTHSPFKIPTFRPSDGPTRFPTEFQSQAPSPPFDPNPPQQPEELLRSLLRKIFDSTRDDNDVTLDSNELASLLVTDELRGLLPEVLVEFFSEDDETSANSQQLGTDTAADILGVIDGNGSEELTVSEFVDILGSSLDDAQNRLDDSSDNDGKSKSKKSKKGGSSEDDGDSGINRDGGSSSNGKGKNKNKKKKKNGESGKKRGKLFMASPNTTNGHTGTIVIMSVVGLVGAVAAFSYRQRIKTKIQELAQRHSDRDLYIDLDEGDFGDFSESAGLLQSHKPALF